MLKGVYRRLKTCCPICVYVPTYSPAGGADIISGVQSVDKLLTPGGRLYEQREFITRAIQDIPGLSVVKPKAGSVYFPLKLIGEMYRIDDDEQFVLILEVSRKSIVGSWTRFQLERARSYFRIVYLPRVDEPAEIQEK